MKNFTEKEKRVIYKYIVDLTESNFVHCGIGKLTRIKI